MDLKSDSGERLQRSGDCGVTPTSKPKQEQQNMGIMKQIWDRNFPLDASIPKEMQDLLNRL